MGVNGRQAAAPKAAWLIVAAALVPLLLFFILQGGYSAREQRQAAESQAQSVSDAVILRADGEVKRLTALLDALGTSGVLRRGDLPAFRDRVRRFTVMHHDIAGVALREPDSGRLLLMDGLAVGAVTRVDVQQRKAGFVGFSRSSTCRCLVFEEAVEGEDGSRWKLILLTRADTFARLLPPLRDYELAAIVDQDGRFIARSRAIEERFGTHGTSFVQQTARSGEDQGIYRGRTLEGLENYTAFSRSDLTGWTAHLVLSSAALDRQRQRYLASLGFAALLSLLLAGFLLAFAIRQLRQSRELAERLQQAQKMEALGQLTGGLAHDFNNLLTPVVGTLDQLQRRESLDERGRKLAAGALSSAQRAAKLTQQLLAFSRRQRLKVEPVDVARLCAEVEELVGRTVSAKHSFRVEIGPDVQCVRSDPNQLELALLNLAINARDASPEGGRITLCAGFEPAREGEGTVRLAVTDEGCGMDEETRRRALEPFFTTKMVGKGTGLGLPQVLGVVEQSGGTLEIESKPGAGTTVTLRLPACEAAEAAASAAAAGVPVPVKAKRILVVDDDPDVRSLMVRMLSEAGHAVEAVSNGNSALAVLAEEPFDLLITDYRMPGLNGVELIERAAVDRSELHYLVVTGFADSDMLARVPNGTALLSKPFTSDELLSAVARANA